jgi:hypothetical protein
VCCLALTAGVLGPRIAIVLWWIVGDKVDAAFGSWFWPLLGVIFLPWTTLFYVIAWSPLGGGGVHDEAWLFVALGVVFDILTYSARAAQSRYRAAAV